MVVARAVIGWLWALTEPAAALAIGASYRLLYDKWGVGAGTALAYSLACADAVHAARAQDPLALASLAISLQLVFFLLFRRADRPWALPLFALCAGLAAAANFAALVSGLILIRVGRRLGTGLPTRPGPRLMLLAAAALLLGLAPRLLLGAPAAALAEPHEVGPGPPRLVSPLAHAARFFDGPLAAPAFFRASAWRIPWLILPVTVLAAATLLLNRAERRIAFALCLWLLITTLHTISGAYHGLLFLAPLALLLARFASRGPGPACLVWGLIAIQAVVSLASL